MSHAMLQLWGQIIKCTVMVRVLLSENSAEFSTIWLESRSSTTYTNKNSSGDEMANVNFYYNDILHVVQNIIRTQNITHNRGSQ